MVTLATAGASPAKIRADPRGVAPPAHRHSRTLHDQLITSRCGSATWSCTLDPHLSIGPNRIQILQVCNGKLHHLGRVGKMYT